MQGIHERTALLIGEEGVKKLNNSHVAVFGIGGVGGSCTEALARAGVGTLTLIDRDTVSESNLNRQIIALRSTIGRYKVDCMKERIADINQDIRVNTRNMFYLPQNADEIDFNEFDYIVDAVDTVTAKLEIICRARSCQIPVISAMGAGGKLHPEAFRIADIYDTKVCPLAHIMRKELKKRGIEALKCVYSEEKPITADRPPGSISFVPTAAGLILAGEVIRDLVLGSE